MEAGKVWMICVGLQQQAMRNHAPWPTRDGLQKAVKGKFGLHSQSAQMVCHAFLANVSTARQLRQTGNKKMRYPWREKRFYPLLWPAQAMGIAGGKIILPMGRGRRSVVLPRPEWLREPTAARIVWNGSGYELHVAVKAAGAPAPGNGRAAIDLGQIHQCAVTTDDGQALLVSGRGIRAEKQRLTKMHGRLARLQSRCQKGSKRWGALQRARNQYALRSARRIRDLRHKGTRLAIGFCVENEVGSLYVGDPDGVRKNRSGRRHNQRMSQWEYGKDIAYLEQKAARAGISCSTGTERGTSSRCPVCRHRQKPKGRNWVCRQCGFAGHRDIVGSYNMHEIAWDTKPETFPASQDVTYRRPGTSSRTWPDRRNRPDTGHREGAGNYPSPVTTGVAVVPLENQPLDLTVQASSEAGHIYRLKTEAHSL